jgi:hypothetical protein
MGTPLHDGVYGPSGVITQPGDAPLQVLIPLTVSSSLVNVELYLSTVDGAGLANFDWPEMGGTIWVANPAPPHSFELIAVQQDGEETLLATQLSPGALLQHAPPQVDHSLSYRWTLEQPLENVTAIKVILRALGPAEEGETAYGIGLDEVRVFAAP